MSTLVTGRLHPDRSFTPDLFADLTPSPWTFAPTGLLFTSTLDAPTQTAIRARMTSRDDADQAKRASLAALAADTETCACCSAVIAYLLGDS